MKISAQVAAVIGAVFAVICYGVAISVFMSLGEVTDPQKLSDAKGFAFFWAFLGTIGAALGAGSWWIAKTDGKRRD